MIHEAIYERLKAVARAKSTTTYSNIAPLANLNMENPADRNTIKEMLDAINREEHQQGHPMLSAVVIRSQNNIPGEGFFTCAHDLGVYKGSEDLMFWIDELKRVHEFWSKQ